jgi:esterase/lipase superfamily enzyme
VGRVLSLSGLWDLKWLTDGYYDETIYQYNPCDFIADEDDPERLAALQAMDIIFAVGSGEYTLPNVEHLSGVLWRKGIGNALRIWKGDTHDWHWWQQMIRLYVGGHD